MMFTFKKKKPNEVAQYITKIVTMYSEKRNIKKLISPISDEYYLIDYKNQIYICIGDGKVTFSNHVFLYKKFYNLSFTDKLKSLIKENIEVEMQNLKKTLFKNETELLTKVLDFAETEQKSQIITHNFKTSAL